MSYAIVPCPKCNRLHGIVAVRANKRGPARQYSGEYVSPLRPASREGQEVPLTRSAPDLREAAGTASPDSPESARSKAAGAVMPGLRRRRPVASLRVGG